MVADLLGIDLLDLAVQPTGTVDVRGALGVDRATPVGFQRLTCTAKATVPATTDSRLLGVLRAEAHRSCVNLATLRAGAPVAASIQVDATG